MQQDRLYVIHDYTESAIGGTLITENIKYGGDLAKILTYKNHSSNIFNIKIFVGYCGWDQYQLQEEIDNGFWEIITMEKDYIFSDFYFG